MNLPIRKVLALTLLGLASGATPVLADTATLPPARAARALAPASPVVHAWEPVLAVPAPPETASVLPANARLVVARGGERLRIESATRPTVGRLFRAGPTLAWLDESDTVEKVDGAWRYVAPLGSHDAVAISVPGSAQPKISRADDRDVGYAWETHEDALVRWADSDKDAAAPAPPSHAGEGAWLEARAAARLLELAGSLPHGGKQLRAALTLEADAVSRPLVSPYYHADGTPLAQRQVDAGKRVEVELVGPRYVAVVARAPRPLAEGSEPSVRVRLDGAVVGGARLPVGPVSGSVFADVDAATPEVWVVRVPDGKHTLAIDAGGAPVLVEAQAFRKREHVGDFMSDDEAIDARISRALGAAGRGTRLAAPRALVSAEALRLAGDTKAARDGFRGLTGAAQPAAIRTLATWRLAMLTDDPIAADGLFEAAARLAAELPEPARAEIEVGVARSRAIRAVAELRPELAANAVAVHPVLWSDPRLALALAGPAVEPAGAEGSAVARMAAAAVSGAPSAALRRALFTRTAWSGARSTLGTDVVPVLVRDDAAGACRAAEIAGDAVYLVGEKPISLEVPGDPLGSTRFRRLDVTSVAGKAPALDASLHVDGESIPLPTVAAVEEHDVALAPGKHRLAARGGAALFIEPPAGVVPDTGDTCARYRRRSFGPVANDRSFPLSAPAGALVGIELRRLDHMEGVVTATLRVDGVTRTLRYVSPRDVSALAVGKGGPVSGSIVVDVIAKDPRKVALVRTDGGAGTLLARPLVRTTLTPKGPAAAVRHDNLAARRAEARKLVASLGDDTNGLEALRKTTLEITAAKDDAARARAHFRRAVVLSRLGRHAYAEEDLRAAAALDASNLAGMQAVLAEERTYVDAQPETPAYGLDAAAPVLASLAGDAATVKLAAEVRSGGLAAREALGAARAARGEALKTVPDGALALAARADEQVGDFAGAAEAYAALAARHPELPTLRVAEAARRLDHAALETGPGLDAGASTRAYVAGILAAGSPGASDVSARATDATRWRGIAHAEASAGSRKDLATPGGAVPTIIANATGTVSTSADIREVRATLAAPSLSREGIVWLEPGLTARAVVASKNGLGVRIETTCAELRPSAAARRGLADACDFTVRVDGVKRDDVASAGVLDLGRLPKGEHAVEITLAPGGLDVLASARVVTDAPVAGSIRLPDAALSVTPVATGAATAGAAAPAPTARFALAPQVVAPRWLADAGEPVSLTILGPTALRLDVAADGAPSDTVLVEEKGRELARAPLGEGGRARVVVALPEERAYQLSIRPVAGRVAVAAELREDRTRPLAREQQVALLAPDITPTPAAPGAPPVAPPLTIQQVGGDPAPGTITLSTGFREGAVGERDSATERGGRYGQVALTYRRRTGDLWWRADGFGRSRLSFDPSGGMGGRLYWRASDVLRLEGGAMGIAGQTPTGAQLTTWFDGTVALRLRVFDDVTFIPAMGAFLRVGPDEVGNPGETDAVDPDVWSRFDADHPAGASAQMRLDWEPFLDLRVSTRVRAVTNADFATVDRTIGGAGVYGVLGRLVWGLGLDLEHRFADEHRIEAHTRGVLRIGGSWGIWSAGGNRISLEASGALRASPDGGERSDAYVGLSYDWTFGRGLRDYAPDENLFSAQIGPWEEPGQAR